jgi:hypothetical protein
MFASRYNYFSWDHATQERYRLRLNKEARLRIEQELLKSLFDLNASGAKEIEDALNTFDNRRYLLFNSAMLLVQGIGDDLFFLNDYLGNDRTLADFETLGAYDYDDYCFQEKALTEESPERAAQPYRGTLYGTWARMLIDGKFFYASLWMASMHVGSVLDDWGQDRIRELIPHRYIRGKKRRQAGKRRDPS